MKQFTAKYALIQNKQEDILSLPLHVAQLVRDIMLLCAGCMSLSLKKKKKDGFVGLKWVIQPFSKILHKDRLRRKLNEWLIDKLYHIK